MYTIESLQASSKVGGTIIPTLQKMEPKYREIWPQAYTFSGWKP